MAKTQGGGRGSRDSSGRRRHGSVSGAKRTTGEEWGHEAVPGSRSAARGRLTKRTMRAWREEETPLAQPSLNELALWPGEAVTAHAVPCRACGGPGGWTLEGHSRVSMHWSSSSSQSISGRLRGRLGRARCTGAGGAVGAKGKFYQNPRAAPVTIKTVVLPPLSVRTVWLLSP